jgi:ribosomal protein L22
MSARANILSITPEKISEIADAIRGYSANSAVLSHDTEQYKEKWVGVYRGRVAVVADSFEGVTSELQAKNIKPNEALIRFVGAKEMTLIL